eukprot:SAG31_NODE_41_length_31342_cov_8.029286_19_plen_74_part_00
MNIHQNMRRAGRGGSSSHDQFGAVGAVPVAWAAGTTDRWYDAPKFSYSCTTLLIIRTCTVSDTPITAYELAVM